MKKVCIISTGGTIGMKETPQGLAPEKGFLEEQLSRMDELSRPGVPEWTVVEYDPVIDSSNMRPTDWMKLARDIEQRYFDHDGFVVLHGTDTMAYTASALPFMLGPIAKPIVLTGSQLPLARVRSDAPENLITSLLVAANYPVPEVCLLFGDYLLRGCRSTKSSAERFDAFESPNFLPLGQIGTSIDIDESRVLPAAPLDQAPNLRPIHSHEMATFRLFPGMSNDVLKNVLQRPLKALIIETFGLGNGPSQDREFCDHLRSAADDGIVLVSCSQCKHGSVGLTEYETGRALLDSGVISGRDITLEAAIAKLHFLFSNYQDTDEIKTLFHANLMGELSE